MSAPLAEQVIGRLEEVLDPCSCMTDNPVNIVDLGLVEEIDVDDGAVDIELLPTTPMCMYMTQIIDEAETEVRKLDRVTDVEITQNVEDIWRPERMDEDLRRTKRQLGPQRTESPDTT